jgi:polygalacturonase
MEFDRVRRREYVAGLTGSLAGLAGCDALEKEATDARRRPTRAERTDTPADGTATRSDDEEGAGDGSADEGADGADESLPGEGRVRYAPPGTVQSTIDGVADDGGGVVRLQAGRTYEEGEPIHVRPGVTLECNHAVLEIADDHEGVNRYNKPYQLSVNSPTAVRTSAARSSVTASSHQTSNPRISLATATAR